MAGSLLERREDVERLPPHLPAGAVEAALLPRVVLEASRSLFERHPSVHVQHHVSVNTKPQHERGARTAGQFLVFVMSR